MATNNSAWLPAETIRKKRDKEDLSEDELTHFVEGIVSGRVSEAQMGAFAMAIVLNGINEREIAWLTQAMAESGERLDWSSLSGHGPIVDKHSTGGVGDKVSLILAPMLAACGAIVPMISGRGLGHTGGTLDKLDAIPGYTSQPSEAVFRQAVQDAGCAIVGASSALAPADRELYAVRDVTATVESIGLITASILSKKLASGTSALVMDIKTGSGAFAPTLDQARLLARSIVDVATQAGLPTRALITDMNSVLGTHAGNALEVQEAVAILRNDAPSQRLQDTTMALGAELLVLGDLAADTTSATTQLQDALTSGNAAERFSRMIHALGGPHNFLDQSESILPVAPIVRPVVAPASGWVSNIDVRRLGVCIVALGGGRRKASDPLDHAVGLSQVVTLGQAIESGTPLLWVHARDELGYAQACAEVLGAISVEPILPASLPPLIYETIS